MAHIQLHMLQLPYLQTVTAARESDPGSRNPQISRPNRSDNGEKVAIRTVAQLTPNIPLYLCSFVDLGMIIPESVDILYSPGSAKLWHVIEIFILVWIAKLMPGLPCFSFYSSFPNQKQLVTLTRDQIQRFATIALKLLICSLVFIRLL